MAPLKDRPFAAILNSRQSKTPLGTDAWIARTLEAVEYAVRELNATIISSCELMTWDLVTWKTGQLSGSVELLVRGGFGDERSKKRLCNSYELHPRLLELRELDDLHPVNRRKFWWEDRDRAIVEAADVIIPVSMRRGGNLERLLLEDGSTGHVDRRFMVPYKPTPHHNRYEFGPEELNPALHRWKGGSLIHWTRTCHGPWPGESVAGFCRDLVASREFYCRDACRTLIQILREQRIRGSRQHISQLRDMVGFTELNPIQSLTQMHWRKRWVNWSFEPFGIAIPRDVAQSLGARPVRYVDESTWRTLPWDERPFCHQQGTESHWVSEREWRLQGDLDLSNVPQDELIIIVYNGRDVDHVRRVWDGPVISMTR